MKTVLGVWCGAGSKLMAQVNGMDVLSRTRNRIGPHFLLIPWTADMDWMDGMKPARRCHPEERLAMRDLVVELGADAGAIIQGDCLTIDREEIALAFARIEAGWEKYESPRVKCYPKKIWLGLTDTDEWGPYPVSAEDLRTLSPKDLEMRWARIRR